MLLSGFCIWRVVEANFATLQQRATSGGSSLQTFSMIFYDISCLSALPTMELRLKKFD